MASRPTPPKCATPWCTRPKARAAGLCHTCYRWTEIVGDALPPSRPSQVERLWRRIERQPNGCWYWTGDVDHGGYGRCAVPPFPYRFAHRSMYELLVEPIPEGRHLDHLCHSRDLSCVGGPGCFHRRCVNPSHLDLVTQPENNRRAHRSPTTLNARKDRCLRGHDLTDPANLYPGKRGERRCKACTKERNLAIKRRERERLRALGLNARGEPRKVPEAEAMWKYTQRQDQQQDRP